MTLNIIFSVVLYLGRLTLIPNIEKRELSFTSVPLIHPNENLIPYRFVTNSFQMTRTRLI